MTDTLESLIAQITHPKKLAFLEHYPECKVSTLATKAANVDESTHYGWLKNDDIYYQAFQELKKRIDTERLELYENELDKRALFGSKQSDILLMFGLKSMNRDRYGDKAAVVSFTGEITFNSNVPEPDYPKIPSEVTGLTTGDPKQLKEG